MMPLRHIPLMLLGLLALPVMAEQTCDTPAQCNQEGTAAYQAGRFEAAIESFERQLRRVENEDEAGLELAVNNLMLANLRAGDAGMARAWLQLALDTNLYGSATRHNLIKVSQALDYPALSASPVGGRPLPALQRPGGVERTADQRDSWRRLSRQLRAVARGGAGRGVRPGGCR